MTTDEVLFGVGLTFLLAVGSQLAAAHARVPALIGGVGVLVALEIVEWPVALVLAVGHQLAHSHHGRVLREFGEALEEA